MSDIEINIISFLAVVVLGTVIQTVTGFAIGLVIMAGVAVFDITDIPFAAAVISFVSLTNALAALRKGHRHIDWHYVKWILAGVMPAMVVGLAALSWLSTNSYLALKLILGTVIVLAGTSLLIAPSPFRLPSGKIAAVTCGMTGGLIAGLYSAGGAPLAYFMYRQPVEINIIRFSLLAIFAGITGARTVMLGVSGQMTLDILKVSAVTIPLVIVVTLLSSKYLLGLPDRFVRLLVFIVMIGVGGFLVIDSAFRL